MKTAQVVLGLSLSRVAVSCVTREAGAGRVRFCFSRAEAQDHAGAARARTARAGAFCGPGKCWFSRYLLVRAM